MTPNKLIAATALCAAMFSGCSTPSTLPYEEPSTTTTSFSLPQAVGPTILTITGDTPHADSNYEVRVDQAMLDAIGNEQIVVHEPFVDKSLSFSGVSVDSFLGSLGIAPDTTLVWKALDGYEITYTRSELAEANAFLATRQDNQLIPIEAGGPLRVVFPENGGSISANGSAWIWSISEIVAG